MSIVTIRETGAEGDVDYTGAAVARRDHILTALDLFSRRREIGTVKLSRRV